MGNTMTPQGTAVPAITEDPVSADGGLIRYVIAFAGPRFPTSNNPAGLDAVDTQLINSVAAELFRRMG
jgi:hypothetical protein